MKDAVNRIIGVIDENGVVVACSELVKIGEVRATLREEIAYASEGVVVGGYNYRPIGSGSRVEYAVFVEGEDKMAEKLSAVIAVIGGKLMDKFGKEKFFYPVAAAGVLGGLIVYLIKFCGGDKALTFALFVVGGTLIEGASLLVAGLFNASARDYTPKDKAGCFQGVRIIIYVTVPMILASLFTPLIINGFGEELKSYNDLITSNSGYNIGDKVYPFELFLFSAVAAAFVFVPSVIVRKQAGEFRRKELLQINADVEGNVDVATEQQAAEQVDNTATDCNDKAE